VPANQVTDDAYPDEEGDVISRVLVALAIAVAGMLVGPTGTAAQRVPKVGVLSPFGERADPFLAALKGALSKVGYVEGRTIAYEYRSAGGMVERLPQLALDLASLKVDVIVTTMAPGVQAARQATKTIPIVIGGVDDAVEQGFVVSLARPDANITGVSWLNTELSAKRVELLKEALPKLSRVAVLREAVGGAGSLRAMEKAARSLGMRLHVIELRVPAEIDGALSEMGRERVGALVVMQGPMIDSREEHIISLATRYRLPTMFADGHAVQGGGLMSYGPELAEIYRHAATYVDRILKGKKPAELPIEQPTRFELLINLKTAEALGLALPQAILLRADGIIQ
jgi:putative tryptophan/tyrosine transport system substrate-binding protein